mmetsp:Transcript_386/g.885  ORF Transcript_386/g.885 Transcript_386/m.885 type:complete len:409 (-) Transcript_386:98-1324(-)
MGCCRSRAAVAHAPESGVDEVPLERPRILTEREVLELFDQAEEVHQTEGGTSGAEFLHTKLPAEHWGISRAQLQDFALRVRASLLDRLGEGLGEFSNMSAKDCKKLGVRYYDDAKFNDPCIGPNMYQVNEAFIKPQTLKGDPVRNMPCLSYALWQNGRCGLLCDLFISHAWSEGVFEFSDAVISAWPDECRGAYICFLSNPQNLGGLISTLVKKPTESPFFRVLLCRPRKMMMVATCNTPIHSRLWCVYEAHCARQFCIPTFVVGNPASFCTNARAARRAESFIRSAVDSKRREAAIDDAMEQAATEMDIILAGVLHSRYQKARRKAERATASAMSKLQRALDVRKAECSNAQDREAIQNEIYGQAEQINAMICELIVDDQLKRPATRPVKLTWYRGQDTLEGIWALF